MPNPTKYDPHFSYTGFESHSPKRPKPGPEIDDDFANISRSVNETIDALSDIRREDGKLQNGIVTSEALAPGALDEGYEDLIGEMTALADQTRDNAEAADASADRAAEYVEIFEQGMSLKVQRVLTVAGQREYTVDADGNTIDLPMDAFVVFRAPFGLADAGARPAGGRTDESGKLILDYEPDEAELLHVLTFPRASNSEAQAIISETLSARDEAVAAAETATEAATVAADEVFAEITSSEGRIFRVPEDYPTIQEVLDETAYLRPNEGAEFEIRISSGHALTAGVNLQNGQQCGHYKITSVDAEVTLASGFTGTLFMGNGATFPALRCLIDATNQVSGNAFGGDDCKWFIAPGSGIKNAYGSGSLQQGSALSAVGANFSGGARNGNTGASAMTWGGMASYQDVDASGSGYYGMQSAHGSIVNARGANTNGAYRYGFRASDGAVLNLDGANGSGAGVIGIYAFNGCLVNARAATAIGCATHNIAATNGSVLCCTEGDFTGSLGNGGYFSGSFVDATTADFSGAAGDYGLYAGGSFVKASGVNARKGAGDSLSDFVVAGGGIISLDGLSIGGTSQEPNLLTPSGVIFDPRNSYSAPVIQRSASWNDANMQVATRSFAKIEPLTAIRAVTGLTGGYEGKEFTIFNVSTTQSLRVNTESTASLEANRFALRATVDLLPGGSALMKYQGGRWRLLAATGVAPQAAIPNAAAGTEIATINAILAALRTAGLIAT